MPLPPTVPPSAAARVHRVESPCGSRDDPYYWLRDDSRSDADVLAHLRAENEYTASVLGPIQPLIDEVYAEIVGRLKQDDASVPARYRGYWYWARYEVGREYPIFMRRADGAPDDAATILLDGNGLAAGHPFFQIGSYEVSPDNRLLAYAVDTVGRRQFELRVKDLITGDLLFVGKVGGTKTDEEATREWTSLQRVVRAIPSDATVWPGHDYGVRPSSTMALEQQTNPFLLCPDLNAFLQLKKDWPAFKARHGLA